MKQIKCIEKRKHLLHADNSSGDNEKIYCQKQEQNAQRMLLSNEHVFFFDKEKNSFGVRRKRSIKIYNTNRKQNQYMHFVRPKQRNLNNSNEFLKFAMNSSGIVDCASHLVVFILNGRGYSNSLAHSIHAFKFSALLLTPFERITRAATRRNI